MVKVKAIQKNGCVYERDYYVSFRHTLRCITDLLRHTDSQVQSIFVEIQL